MNIDIKLNNKIKPIYGDERVAIYNFIEMDAVKKYLLKNMDNDIVAFIFSFESTLLNTSFLQKRFVGQENYRIAREMDITFFLQHIKNFTSPNVYNELKKKYPVNFIFMS
jgi:hypothetical protein